MTSTRPEQPSLSPERDELQTLRERILIEQGRTAALERRLVREREQAAAVLAEARRELAEERAGIQDLLAETARRYTDSTTWRVGVTALRPLRLLQRRGNV